MGRAVYEQSARAREIFDEADRVVGYKLSKICFDGPSTELDNTTVAQPAILTTSVAILEAFIESVNAKLGRRSSDGVEPRGRATSRTWAGSALTSPRSCARVTFTSRSCRSSPM